MDYNKIEDTVMKKAMEFFKDNAVKFFGINTKVIAPAETEIKSIDIKNNSIDYLFHTENGELLHFEFQTTDKKDDLKRFLYYDASLYYRDSKRVRTMVIYSADIEGVETELDVGTIKYSIEAFYMKNLDGDRKLEYLKRKIENKEHLTDEDILNLSFIPLMKTKMSKSERALESIELANKIPESNEKLKCMSLLYALFEKFGDNISKKRFMEVFTMTEIGRMIREDGKEEGKLEGKQEGKAEMLIKLLIKKFKSLPEEYKNKIKALPEETIEVIATEIFDIEKLEDIKQYFNEV
jgi:predicted transposase/invertase (TIGR01784 family)